MIPALRACATSARILASDGAPGATKPPLPELAAAGSRSGLPTFPVPSVLPPGGSPGGSGSDRVRPPLPPTPVADAPVAALDVAEVGVVARECCCWTDAALCAERADRGGAEVGEPP